MDTRQETSRFAWTLPQRRVLLLFLTIVFACLALRYVLNPSYVSDPQPDRPARYDELADRIDPNTADWQTLAALPGIGEKRAKDIVAYREDAKPRAKGGVVFLVPQDLLRVKGIGVTMLEGISPYLTLTEAPTTTTSAPASGR